MDYEKLTIELETNGGQTPNEAIAYSAGILNCHFNVFDELDKGCFSRAIHTYYSKSSTDFKFHGDMTKCINFATGIFEGHIFKFYFIISVGTFFRGQTTLIHIVWNFHKIFNSTKETGIVWQVTQNHEDKGQTIT